MPISDKKPQGLLRFGFRLPVWLYRWHLGWILGERFLLLTHKGRKSGVSHQTVIEVVGHNRSTDTYYVVSGFGRKADWFLNIQHDPHVSITVGWRTISVRATHTSEETGAKILFDYARHHPLAFRELSMILIGRFIEPNEENCRQFLESLPMMAFEPVT